MSEDLWPQGQEKQPQIIRRLEARESMAPEHGKTNEYDGSRRIGYKHIRQETHGLSERARDHKLGPEAGRTQDCEDVAPEILRAQIHPPGLVVTSITLLATVVSFRDSIQKRK